MLPEQQRAETGVMQFEEDWPGVFIRGDNAAMWAMAIREVLSKITESKFGYSYVMVKGLADLLSSSDTRSDPTPQKARLLPNEQTQ